MSQYSVEVENVSVSTEVVSTSVENLTVGQSGNTTVTISDVGVAGPTGPSGPAGPASTVAGPATPVDYQGTGFPEGVVTATVGKTYRDNNATNGAILWVKASGTGNTGWKVVHGDTGWRYLDSTNFSSTVTEGAIRRVNNNCHLFMSGIARNYGALVYTIPNGFRGEGGLNVGGYAKADGVQPISQRTSGNFELNWTSTGVYYHGSATADSPVNFKAFWFASDVWPSALPGVSAT